MDTHPILLDIRKITELNGESCGTLQEEWGPVIHIWNKGNRIPGDHDSQGVKVPIFVV